MDCGVFRSAREARLPEAVSNIWFTSSRVAIFQAIFACPRLANASRSLPQIRVRHCCAWVLNRVARGCLVGRADPVFRLVRALSVEVHVLRGENCDLRRARCRFAQKPRRCCRGHEFWVLIGLFLVDFQILH